MKANIEIDTRTFFRFWGAIIALAAIVAAIFLAQTALIILGTSLFLALALNSPVSFIARKLPGKSRVAASAIAYVIVVAVLGAIILLVIPPIVQQTAKFVENVPTFVDNVTSQWHGVRDLVAQYNLQPQVDGFMNSIKDNAAGWASNVGQSVIGSIGSIFAFFGALFLVLVLTFFMLIEGPKWMERIWGLYNNRSRMEIHKRIAHRVYGVINGYVTGQLTVSAIGATFAGLVVFILSLIFPSIPGNLAFATAALTFLFSLIPMFGATIGGVIITALLAFNALPAALIYVVYFVVYQQIENNLISPHIQSRKNELSALAVLASITIGLYMFGIPGGIIAIPIAGSLGVLLDEYLKHTKSQRGEKKALPAKTKS